MQEEGKSRWPSYVVYTLIVIVILILILILFLYLIRSPLIFRSGAASLTTTTTNTALPVSSSSLSLDNSYIFASPLRAKTGGEKIRVTVYILDNRGLGISGKDVVVTGGDSVQVTSIQPVTDSQGRATFDIGSASSPGTYTVQASVDGVTLTQKVTISFD